VGVPAHRPPPLPAVTRPQYPSSVSIAQDQLSADECYRCGYDLRGIANDRACPECGLLAERSRRVSDELHNSRPRWLRKLSRGVWLILMSPVLLLLLVVASALLDNWIYVTFLRRHPRTSWHLVTELVQLIGFLGVGIAAVTFLLGTLMLTAREQYVPADRADRLRRVLLRAVAAVPLFGVLADGALNQSTLSAYITPDDRNFFVSHLAVLVASIPLPALLFYQLRSLAKRARSAHLAEHCAIVGIGMSSAVLYLAIVVITFHIAEQHDPGEMWALHSSLSFVLLLLCTVSASLFVLWSVYLLIRFAIAFRSAARQLHQKWKRDDRAR
jgi:hypothetical protein